MLLLFRITRLCNVNLNCENTKMDIFQQRASEKYGGRKEEEKNVVENKTTNMQFNSSSLVWKKKNLSIRK